MTEDELIAENALLRSCAIRAFQMCRMLISEMRVTDETRKASALVGVDEVVAQLESGDPTRTVQ